MASCAAEGFQQILRKGQLAFQVDAHFNEKSCLRRRYREIFLINVCFPTFFIFKHLYNLWHIRGLLCWQHEKNMIRLCSASEIYSIFGSKEQVGSCFSRANNTEYKSRQKHTQRMQNLHIHGCRVAFTIIRKPPHYSLRCIIKSSAFEVYI